MKIGFYATKKQAREYTYKLIRFFLNGIDWVKPEEAELLLVSICDPTEVTVVKQAQKVNPSAYILMGGAESYIGVPYLAWVDAVCVGEGFECFDLIQKYSNDPLKKFVDILEQQSYVLTKEKLTEKIYSSYHIPWEKIPAIQLRKQVYYYLAGRGCRRKCRFCYTSWTQKFQSTSPRNIIYIQSKISKHGRLTLVANDGSGVPEGFESSVKSVRIEEFIRNPLKFRNIRMFHMGVEAFSEKTRRWLGKPILEVDIQKAIMGLKQIKRPAEFFFILGISQDGEPEEFINLLPQDVSLYPKIFCKFTWLDYCPHTPFWKEEIPEYIKPFKGEEFFYRANGRNKRIRTFPCKDRSNALWRSIFHRCWPDEAILVEPLKNCKRQEEFWEKLAQVGLSYKRIMKENFPGENIKVSIR